MPDLSEQIDHPLAEKAINTIRFLAADAVEAARSGHPGLPMGAAPMGYTLWQHHLSHDPNRPDWPNRDRFILSGGHGSMLLYALLHLTGYPLSLDEIRNFRQRNSLTPGHPEAHHTPGVEVTTGPLGQGFANGVGMAIAEAHLAARYNRPGHEIVDHYTYAIVTDGDLMEGVAAEAASLAGHLRLSKLIYLYDDNEISIEGSTDLAFTENRTARFDALGWHTQSVDGHDLNAVHQAIQAAKVDPRPSLIACRTVIGFGLPTRQNTSKAHGEPPGEEELNGAKAALGWPVQPRFLVPGDVFEHMVSATESGVASSAIWDQALEAYTQAHPELSAEYRRVLAGELPEDWADDLTQFAADPKGIATRQASGTILNDLAEKLPELMGGSADLAGSNKTMLAGEQAFQHDARHGRNFHFGVREHGMAAIMNGMAVHGGLIPYGGTFLVFTDYMRGAMRLAALVPYPVIYVLTHDSIGLGEDGPTHQPIEHLAALRAIPNFIMLRPGDANEVREAWKIAVSRRDKPVALALTRQSVPTVDREIFAPAEGLTRGAYVLADLGEGDPDVILMASGSEVGIVVEAGFRLMSEGVNVRLISFPSWELFEEQSQEYKDEVLPPAMTLRVAVEAGIAQGWDRWIGIDGQAITLEHFGASAPFEQLYAEFGLTAENVFQHTMRLIRERRADDGIGWAEWPE
jgi:transketolase